MDSTCPLTSNINMEGSRIGRWHSACLESGDAKIWSEIWVFQRQLSGIIKTLNWNSSFLHNLGPLNIIISKISLQDFLSEENLCHWTSERDCECSTVDTAWTKYCEQHLLPGDKSQTITAKQTSSTKIYCRNTKSSSRCWPRGARSVGHLG